MIDPSDPEFNFDSFSKFVINASELANAELHDLLYTYPNKIPKEIMAEARKKDRRSRNTASTLMAGQSLQTLSFFKAKPVHQNDPNFYAQLKNELRNHDDATIYQLMSDYQSAKFSVKRNGFVAAYGANTNQGIAR